MGTYFLYFQRDEDITYVSSLALPENSENVLIPVELTNIVGGYVKESKEPLIDSVVPSGSFTLIPN